MSVSKSLKLSCRGGSLSPATASVVVASPSALWAALSFAVPRPRPRGRSQAWAFLAVATRTLRDHVARLHSLVAAPPRRPSGSPAPPTDPGPRANGPQTPELVTLCSSCHKKRDRNGQWVEMEAGEYNLPNRLYTHGICPECAKKLYPDLYELCQGNKNRSDK